MTKHRKLIIALLIVIIYGSCIALFKGRLPNQTATIVDVKSSDIKSLAVNETQNIAAMNISLSNSVWSIKGENVTAQNSDGKLVISGSYKNATLPLFVAQQIGLHINFSDTPYLYTIISSTPDVYVSFNLGLLETDPVVREYLIKYHPEVIVESDENLGIVWINSTYLKNENIDDQTHHITIDFARSLSELALDEQYFVGLQIRQYLIGFKAQDNHYETKIQYLGLLDQLPYYVTSTNGKGYMLSDGSIVHIIKKDQMENQAEDCSYLQRAYILYRMEASQDSLYTIFLLSKHDENITAVRTGFVFVHSNRLNEVGTHIDWRRPTQLNDDFQPVATLNSKMENGDYAVIFTPLEESSIRSIQLDKVEFTFSKLPYSSFVIKTLSEQVLLTMSSFLLTVAGILPTTMLLILFYAHKKNKLKDNRNTAIKIVVIGMALRFVLAPISAYLDDLQIFAQIGALFFGPGVLGAQWVSLPGFVYLETASYFPYALLRSIGFQDFQFLALAIYSTEALFVKLPAILSDLGSFYFIRKMAGKYAPGEKILLPALFLLNPLTVYVSGILGQFDSIFTFAVIASIYYLVAEYDSAKATIFSSFASIINIVGVAIFIPLLANAKLRENWKTVAKILLLATCIFVIAMLPFFFETKSPLLLTSYERLLSGVPGEAFYGKQIRFYTYGTLISSSVGYGLTFRFLLEILGFQLGSIFYPYGAAFAFFAFTGIFIYKIHKKYKTGSRDVVYTGIFMLGVASLFQLVFPTIFDQFVVWIAGLLLVSYILCRDRTFLAIFALISVATGFVYVLTWRNYLLLVSGVETVALVNPYVSSVASSLIGALYSLLLFIILAKILRVLTKNNRKANSDMHEMS